MKIVPTKLTKFPDELKGCLSNASSGYCQCSYDCVEKADSFHHIWENTQTNRAKFPLYIQSPFNMCFINTNCHMTKPLPKKPPERLVKVFEDYLMSLLLSKFTKVESNKNFNHTFKVPQ